MKKIIGILLIIFLLSACGTKKTESIKIGAVIPLTGEVATYGESLKKGFDIAVADYNGKFQIIYEDSKAIKNTGISAINKLISSDNVKFVLGDATSGVTLAIAPIAEKNKVILMVPIATSDAIIESGDYIFRNAPSNFKQAITAARFIIDDLNIKNIAILYNQTDYGINLAEKFKLELKAQNIIPVFESSYQDGTTDFKTILTKMKDAKPNAVFVPGNYEETAIILKQATEIDINVPFVGTDGAYSPKLVELAGSAAEDFYLTMMGVNESSDMYKNFLAKYKAKYNSDPDVFTCYGYEAAKIIFETISKSGNDPENTKLYLYQNTFPSLTNLLKFDNNGEVIRDYVIFKVSNNAFKNFKEDK